MTGIQAACFHAQRMGWELTHIEIVKRNLFDTTHLQEVIILDVNQSEVYIMFNIVHANNTYFIEFVLEF